MSLPTQQNHAPLLLTKRLTTFLHANSTPQLPTLLVTSPTGKLLAHASQQPVSILRTHATVAASLLAIHTSSSPALPSALPGSQTPPAHYDEQEEDTENEEGYGDDDEDRQQQQQQGQGEQQQQQQQDTVVKPATITIQLTGGTVLIRRLKCGLLFVCVGPASSSPTSDSSATGGGIQSNASAGGHTGNSNSSGEGPLHSDLGDNLASNPPAVSATPSEADSSVSAGAQTTGSLDGLGGAGGDASAAVAMRKHAAELARWLDDKLGTLAVPDDGVGVE